MTNVTPIESKQPAPAGAKFTITATLDGFPISIEIENADANKLRGMIDRLKAIGAQPPKLESRDVTPKSSAPLCPVHDSPMKASRKPGKFYCAKRADDGEYCRETA